MKRSICALALAAVAVSLTACNDGIKCETGALVLITAPTSDVVQDSDPSTPGTQVDVHVRSTLPQGEALALTVTDFGGAVVGTATTTADPDGNAVFVGVTLPTGKSTVTVAAQDGCGMDSSSVQLDVLSGSDCAIAISPTPAANTFYAPLTVLNAAADPDPTTPGFQSTVMVTTALGWSGELFVTGPDGQETSQGMMSAAGGDATWPVTLPDGRSSFRAVCTDPTTGSASASLTTSVLVDTIAPTCAMVQPAPGTTITPALDADDDLSNGVQLTLGGMIGGGDVAGDAATFTVIAPDGSMSQMPGTAIDASGSTTVAATFAPTTTPADYSVSAASDHAGNPCTPPDVDYKVVYNGCAIAVTAPTGPVTADVDGNPANGAQLDATLTVDPACAGQTVTSDCGVGTTMATVPAGGDVTMRLTACNTDPCMVSESCSFSVTTTDGVTTSAGLSLVFDDQAPPVSLTIINPAVACGAQLDPSVDVDPATDGVQVTAQVTTSGAATEQVKVTNASGSSTVNATAPVNVTLAAGTNTLVGIASDALGNTATTPGCALTLSDLTVSFSPPAADGMLAASDGTVSGNDLTTDICGTVDKTGAAVTLAVDGAPAQPATVTGTSWCRQVTLAVSPPSHTLVATATAGSSFGSATLVVSVDLTPPGGVTDLVATAPNRRDLHATWTAPSDGGNAVDHYVVKLSTTTLTTGNFATTGQTLTVAAPKAPGSAETLDVPVRMGASYWIGIAASDAAGNLATPAIAGPLTPAFDQSPAIVPPDPADGDVGLGWAFAHGKFNDDDYDDVAVGAATRQNGTIKVSGAVYVYFGGPNGLGSTPDVIIQSSESAAELGTAVTAVRWSSATRDDLVIGAPFSQSGRGRVFVFHGGATFPASGATVDATTADQIIGVNASNPGWFAAGELGWSLATADFDGDGTNDLAIGAIAGGGTKGGVVVLFGGTAGATSISLSDIDASGLAGAEAQLIENPTGVTGQRWGRYLFDVGHTTAASDDLLIGQTDNTTTATDSVWLYRGAATRKAGVSGRAFTPGTDVEIDYVTADNTTFFGSAAASVSDVDGDGVRDLAIGAWEFGNNDGQVVIVSGATVGASGVAQTGSPGVVVTTIDGASGQRLGATIADRAGTSGDIDGDGKDDLMVGGVFGGAARFYVWYGGAIAIGTITTTSAAAVLSGPSTFAFDLSGFTPAGAAAWVGDVNGDGLDDVCWSSPVDNGKDGSFQLLWDDEP